MVKRYYVITVGTQVGVFYDYWTNIAHFVKNKTGATWQRVSSQEEAEELFENARLNNTVRVLPTEQPKSNRSHSRTGSAGMAPNRFGSNGVNPRSPRMPPTPIPVHIQTHAYGSAPRPVPTVGFGSLNVTHDSQGNIIRRAINGANAVPTRTYYELTQQVPIASGPNTQTPSVTAPTTPNRGRRAPVCVVVDSPPWLSSYPDEDEDAFLTPPLSPIASPINVPRSLGRTRSEPASNFTAAFDAAEYSGREVSEHGSDSPHFHVPKPVKQSSSYPSTPGAKYSEPNTLSAGKDRLNIGQTLSLNIQPTSRTSTPLEERKVVDDVAEFVTNMDNLVKDLRNCLAVTLDESSQSFGRAQPGAPECSGSGPSALTSSLDHGNRGNDNERFSSFAISGANESGSQPLKAFGSPNMSNGQGVPSRSVLFSQNHGLASPRAPSSIAPSLSTCKHCNGTGYSVTEDTSLLLSQTGLMQPGFVQYHSHDSTYDPRSPLPGSRQLHAPVSSPVSFGRPSPTLAPPHVPELLPIRPSPVLISPIRRV